MFVCFQFCFVLLHTAFILVTNLLFGDFFKILVLWIFLFPVHSLLFVILPTIPHCGLFLPVYGKLSSVVIVFSLGFYTYHLVCGSFTTEQFFKCFCQSSQTLHQSRPNFTSVSQLRYPHTRWKVKFTVQPWQGQTWGFHGLEGFSLPGPQAESF